ncbi:MAG: hypothetical protein ABIH08_05785 [Candidatus Omnitrophota bacterium]
MNKELSSNSSTQIYSAGKSRANSRLGSSAKAVSRTLLNITTGAIFVIPEAAGIAVGSAAAVLFGTVNMIKYKKNKKTKKQAIKDTIVSSSGVGISAGLGVAAGAAAAEIVAGTVAAEIVTGVIAAETAFALATVIAIPVITGIAVSYCSMKIWNKLFRKNPLSP